MLICAANHLSWRGVKNKYTSFHAQPPNVNACWSRLSCAAYQYHKKQRCRQHNHQPLANKNTQYIQRCSPTSQFADVDTKGNYRSGTNNGKKARRMSWSFIHPFISIHTRMHTKCYVCMWIATSYRRRRCQSKQKKKKLDLFQPPLLPPL